MRGISFLQQVTTDGTLFTNIRRKTDIYSGTRYTTERNILNESDRGYGSKHGDEKEAENVLESIPDMK